MNLLCKNRMDRKWMRQEADVYLGAKILQLPRSSQPRSPRTNDDNFPLQESQSFFLLFFFKRLHEICLFFMSERFYSRRCISLAAAAASPSAHQCWWGPSWSWSAGPDPFPARSVRAPNRGRWCSAHISVASAPPDRNTGKQHCVPFSCFIFGNGVLKILKHIFCVEFSMWKWGL